MQACQVLQLARVVEVLDVPSLVIILSRKPVTKAQISLRICAFVTGFLESIILVAVYIYVIVIPWVVRMYVEIIHEL